MKDLNTLKEELITLIRKNPILVSNLKIRYHLIYISQNESIGYNNDIWDRALSELIIEEKVILKNFKLFIND